MENKMGWEIIVHAKSRYLEVITWGNADKDGSLAMAQAVADNMKRHHTTRAMIDHRKIESVQGGVFDVYNRPKVFKLIGVIFNIKIAEVIKPEHMEHFRFFETVCLNQGYEFSIFQEKEEAEKWLLS